MSKLDELLEQKKQIEAEIQSIKEQKYQAKLDEIAKFRESIPEEVKKWLLDNVKHQCGSCNHDDKYPNNGWSDYDGYPRCIRCALAEYFNQPWNMDDVEMLIGITFVKIRP